MKDERIDFLGIPIDVVTMDEAVDRLDSFVATEGTQVALAVYAHCVNTALQDQDYMAALHAADLIYVDGMSIVWASRLLGTPLPQKLTTTDLIHPLAARSAERGYSFYLLGALPGVAQEAAHRLQELYPGLGIAGAHHGYFTPAEERQVIEGINRARPGILFVGMGMPKQEKWIAAHRHELAGVSLCMSCGALFDFLSGRVRRGPRWMTTHGLEWLYRLGVEPGRMWRRYVLGNPLFLLRVLGQRFTKR